MKPPKNSATGKIRKGKEINNASSSSSSSYLAEDENYQKFAAQLGRLGLELRDITGDGNCCFRALSDQMNGTEAHHLEYRRRVCQYMRQSRDEFEPFVAALIDDDEPSGGSSGGGGEGSAETTTGRRMRFMSSKKIDAYERYIKNLEQPGTYADNGCLVAFARLYQVNINIHQLDMPIWTINGLVVAKNRQVRELHLSYHNGEHYSSIRPIGDHTNTPTNIFIMASCDDKASGSSCAKSSKTKSSNKSNACFYNDYDDYGAQTTDGLASEYEFNEKVEEIIEITKCMDINLIKEKLAEHNYDTEQTINYFISQHFDKASEISKQRQNQKPAASKLTAAEKKMEKKMRQMERQQLKVIEQQEQQSADSKEKKSKSSLQSDQQQLLQAASDDLSISISNIQTKSI